MLNVNFVAKGTVLEKTALVFKVVMIQHDAFVTIRVRTCIDDRIKPFTCSSNSNHFNALNKFEIIQKRFQCDKNDFVEILISTTVSAKAN